MKQYKDWNPNQMFLLPPSPHDWLPEGHLAYFILEIVSELDIRGIIEKTQAKDPRGERPYAPQMMMSLLLYGYCVGVYSSRKIERATYEDVAFRVIAGGNHPHFTRINAFRKDNLEVLRGLFVQVLKLCQKAGLVKLGHVALDGTKIEANASKHKAMSYKYMKEKEKQLDKEIKELFRKAEEMDTAEDERFGVGHREADLPAELKRRTDRLARIKQAKLELEKESRQARAQALLEQAERANRRSETTEDPVESRRAATFAKNREKKAQKLIGEQDDNDDDDHDHPPFTTDDGLPKHRPPVTTDGKPTPKAQRNFTDPDSRIMERGGTFLQGYNAQTAVDDEHQIIVGQSVTNQCPDNGNLVPMLEQVLRNCGEIPRQATAESGYWHTEAPQRCSQLGIDVYISTGRQKHSTFQEQDLQELLTDLDNVRQQMRTKLSNPEGRAIYARRKAIVEPVFGQIKEARGFRHFRLRGLAKVQTEWAFICACHNVLKLFKARH
jgi:transposase